MNAGHLTLIIFLLLAHLFLLYFAGQRFIRIPDRRYKKWFLTPDHPGLTIPLMQHTRFRIRLLLHLSDKKEEVIPVFIPSRASLGDLFSRFIISRQKTDPNAVEIADAQGLPYAWEFYLSGLGGMTKRILDPEVTLFENKLKKDDVIVVRRLTKTAG